MSFTFVVPTVPSRPFVKGDIVDTMDREGKRMETVKVLRAGPRVVKTSCGRTWTQDGYYLGHQAWPFPWIRHSRRKTCDVNAHV